MSQGRSNGAQLRPESLLVMTEFLKLCDDCKCSQLEHYSKQEGGKAPSLCEACASEFPKGAPRPCFSFGYCPSELITLAAKSQCPEGYPMTIRCQDEWKVISDAWNQGIDSHLEALTERSSADSTTGKVNVHPEELCTLLRRFYESESDEAWSLRSSILSTLGIEEC